MSNTRPRALGPGDKIAVAVLCVAQFMLIVDVVVVNVALPTLRASLGLADAQLFLTVVSYTATFGALLIAAGRAGDAWGRRPVFLTGIAVFTVASLVAGLAQEPWQFFAARAVQGVGAAMVSPNALALLLSRFEDTAARNRAMGVWGAVGAGGAIAGQVLGGVIVSALGWRWVFLVNVPIGVVALVAAAATLHRSGGEARRMDPFGSLLLVGALAPTVLALAWLPDRGPSGFVLGCLGVSLGCLAVFVLQQRRTTDRLVPTALMSAAGVRPANALIALSAATVTASLFFTTLYLQVVLGHSAMMVGLAFAPITLLIMGLAPLSGKLVSRRGARDPLLLGLTTGALGMVMLSRISTDGSYWSDVLPALLLVAVGSALTYVPTYIAATARVRPEDQGAASGLLNTSQELGPAIGLAAIASTATAFIGGARALGDLVAGYRMGLLVSAALMAIGLLVALRIPRDLGRVPDPTEEGHEADDIEGPALVPQ